MGTSLITEDGKKAKVTSKEVAIQSTCMVTASRIGMVAPAMLLTPIFMDKLHKRAILARYLIINCAQTVQSKISRKAKGVSH